MDNNKIESCNCSYIHEDILSRVKEHLPKEEVLYELAEIFKVFADSTRMKIICALEEKELCVGEIAYITNSTQSAISHQLRVLKQARLVKFRRDGKIVYYSLADDHVKHIFNEGLNHVLE